MITVKAKRDYELKVTLNPKDGIIYQLVKESYEADLNGVDHFLHVDKIFKWINDNLKSKVPYKRVYSPSYRICHFKERYTLCVTFDLDSDETTFYI